MVFQPRKVARSGLLDAVEGHALIYIHKEQMLDDVERRYPASHYVMVDDKLRILTAMKTVWGTRLTTVFVRQGHYARDPDVLAAYPAADVGIERIGDLARRDLEPLLGAATGGKTMIVSPLAGKPATPAMLVNVPALVTAYYTGVPDPSVPGQRVAFGTSGHRGSSLDTAFNEWHILAIAQAICLYREQHRIDGPLFLGADTHALSVPACASALEVMAANGVVLMIADGDEYTPTPAVSHAILSYNRGRTAGLADGVVITPSHNPPDDGGFKYNPPHGGPAEPAVTRWVEAKANELLDAGLRGVNRIPYEKALRASTTHRHDYVTAYTSDLVNVHRHGRHPWCEDRPRGGSARGRRRALLGAHRRALRTESHRRQRRRRSHVPLHDRRLGRPDSHGPVLALRDAAADRREGPVRDRRGVRHRPRPTRHRHAERRAASAESLSRGGRSPISSSIGRGGARTRRWARRW